MELLSVVALLVVVVLGLAVWLGRRWPSLARGGSHDRSVEVVSRSVGVVDLVEGAGDVVALGLVIVLAILYGAALAVPEWVLLVGTGLLYAAGWIALGLAVVLPLGWLFERWRVSRL